MLNTALAPVAPGCSPPVWLDVLRCLLDVKKRGLLSRAVALHSVASTQQDSFTLAAAASVWIGGGGPDGLEDENGERSTRQAWIRWYDAELGGLIPTAGTRSGRWLVLSTSAGEDGVELVNVRAGEGWPARTLTDVTWENRGRSPLEAAWNVPAGQSTGSTGGSRLATIVLPPFAAWLRVVLRGDGQRCSETELDGYLRRMAREVYLPCEFGSASNEMARQWLAALIEAEAVAEANTPIDLTTASGACGGGWARQGDVPDSAAIRRAAVTAFFRAELLKFGSGDDAPVAPVGGPLSWLWPLEAVVAACGRAGPLGGGFFRPYLYAKIGVEEGRGVDPLSLNDPPSALARALSSVPYDLLCGSRRFGAGGERPSPATVRAFATRAVDLAARALAAPSCRQWSVARRLLLGLGLLYHALATPEPRAAARAALSGPTSTEPAAIAVPGTGSKARYALDAEEAATARSAALNTIESLLRIAFGMDRAAVDERASASAVSGWQARPATLPLSKPGTSTLPTACRSLRPLEIGGGSGWKDFLKALRGAGAWRTAATLSKPLNVEVINAPPKVPAAQPLTTATTASFRSRRQSLPTRWKTDDAEREIKRSALPPATHDDSGFHIETSEKNTGASTAKPGSPTTCWTPSQADRKHQRSKGQDDGDTSPSFTPVPLSSHEQGRNLQFRAPKDDQPVTAYNTPSTPRRSLRSTRRTPKAVE